MFVYIKFSIRDLMRTASLVWIFVTNLETFGQKAMKVTLQTYRGLDAKMKQDQTGLDRSARSTMDFGAKGLKVSRS